MSRRESRDYDSKRHRSKFDREPSPKRSRKDGKQEIERISKDSDVSAVRQRDREEKLHRGKQGVSSREAPVVSGSKVETVDVSKEPEKKADWVTETDKRVNGSKESDKKTNDQKAIPRSRNYFQHDQRASAGQIDRDSRDRKSSGRGWWRDSKDRQDGREARNETRNRDAQDRDDNPRKSRENDSNVWCHDGFFELEGDPTLPPPPPLPERRRPAFTEKKISSDPENPEKMHTNCIGSERRDERGGHNPRHLSRPEKPFARDSRPMVRGEDRRFDPTRDNRYGRGSGNSRGRERNIERPGYRPNDRVDKWKHDMFHEANRSPTPKKEEDHIAKVEALLAS